jgi:hypothetical protein
MTGFALLNFAETGAAVPAITVGDQALPVGTALAATGQGSAGQALSVEIGQIGRLNNPIVQGE